MALTTKTAQIKDVKLLVMTGEAAQMAGCDRRTFKEWAKKLNVKPFDILKGNKEVYKREDAERIAKAYKAFQKDKEAS